MVEKHFSKVFSRTQKGFIVHLFSSLWLCLQFPNGSDILFHTNGTLQMLPIFPARPPRVLFPHLHLENSSFSKSECTCLLFCKHPAQTALNALLWLSLDIDSMSGPFSHVIALISAHLGSTLQTTTVPYSFSGP